MNNKRAFLPITVWLACFVCFFAPPAFSGAVSSYPSVDAPVSQQPASQQPASQENPKDPSLTVFDLPVVQLTHRHQSTSLLFPPESSSSQYFSRPLIDNGVLQSIRLDPDFNRSLLSTTHMLLTDDISFSASIPRTNLTQDVAEEFLRTLDPSYVFFSKKDIDVLTADKSLIEKTMSGENLNWIDKAYALYQKNIDAKINLLEKNTSTVASSFSFPTFWEDSEKMFASFSENQVLALMGMQGLSRFQATKAWKTNFTKIATQAKNMDKTTLVQLFLRSYATACDPHSLYLSPAQKNQFQRQINKTFEGMGFSWGKKEDGRVLVVSVTPASPAEASGLLPNDEVVSVKTPQGDILLGEKTQQEIIKIFENANPLINLNVKRDGKTINVSISSARIALTSSLAQAHHFLIHGKRVLLIDIPSFYYDPQDPTRRGGSVTLDVRGIIERAKKNTTPPDLIALDFRGNAGGVLIEATSLLGLFLHEGVSTQVRAASTPPQALEIKPDVVWEGPLVALVDSGSASASEITVSSLQDYKRALVVGQQTYGKGSAQTLFDFDALANLPVSLFGQVNLTTMVFHRPNGQAVQLHGVFPDLEILPPSPTKGERSFRHILENTLKAPDLTKDIPDPSWINNIPQGRSYLTQSLSQKIWYPLWVEKLKPSTMIVSLNEKERTQQIQKLTQQQQFFKQSLELEEKQFSAYGADVLLQYGLKASLEVFFPSP